MQDTRNLHHPPTCRHVPIRLRKISIVHNAFRDVQHGGDPCQLLEFIEAHVLGSVGQGVQVEQAGVVKGEAAVCTHPLITARVLARLLVQSLDGALHWLFVLLEPVTEGKKWTSQWQPLHIQINAVHNILQEQNLFLFRKLKGSTG